MDDQLTGNRFFLPPPATSPADQWIVTSARMQLTDEFKACDFIPTSWVLAPEDRFALLFWKAEGVPRLSLATAERLACSAGLELSTLRDEGVVAIGTEMVRMLSAHERRRAFPLTAEEVQSDDPTSKRKRMRIHPNDPAFRTHFDKAQALALAYAGARSRRERVYRANVFFLKHGMHLHDGTMRLINAIVHSTQLSDQHPQTALSAYTEFSAWNALRASFTEQRDQLSMLQRRRKSPKSQH